MMSRSTHPATGKDLAFRQSSEKGMSLIMAVSIGFFVSLWLYSMMAIVLPAYHRASAGRIENTLKDAAEDGLEYAISQLNRACANDVLSNLDSDREGAEPNTTELPDYVCGDKHIKVFISVCNKRPPQSSWVYNPEMDPAIARSKLTSIGENGWRVLTATAVCGNLRKSIRCVLQPVYTPASLSSATAQIDAAAPYFRFGLVAIQSIQFRGTTARLEPFSSSALAQGVAPSNVPPQLTPALSLPAGVMPPALEPIGDNIVSGRITGGDDAICSGPEPGEICRLGSIVLHRGSTLQLSSGDYQISSLKLEEDAELKLIPGKSGYGPVRLFVSGCSGKHSSVEIDGGRIANPSNIPSNLQIWYNGSQPITVHGAPGFCGVLYAPNAEVTIGCSDSIRGAVLGRELIVDGPGGLAFDLDLLKDPNLQFPVSTTDSQYRIFCKIAALKAITWEEL
jgi:hypothetical protein